MDRQRTFYYGFIVGVVLMVLPLPNFFFWDGVLDNVEAIFGYGGFFLLVSCGLPLVIGVLQALFFTR